MRARRPPSMDIGDALVAVGGGEIARTFQYVEIAEKELARAGVSKTPGAFAALYPGEFTALRPELYRAHARELAERIADLDVLSPGTKAEVIVALHVASLAAPLVQAGAMLYARLLAEVLPDEIAKLYPDGLPREEWPGQFEEELHAARLRCGRSRSIPRS